MIREDRKRFYEAVSVRREGEGFVVALDEHNLKTPQGNLLFVPARSLAEALADEWAAQKDRIEADCMPLTRLINTALDRTSLRKAPVVQQLAAYGETDLLCHRADYPEELILRQRTAWQPILDWAAETLNVRLKPVAGIRARPQDGASLDLLRRHLEALDSLSLTAAEAATSVTGSIILTLALAYGRLDVCETWRLSRVDEDYHIEKWGEDEEASRQAEVRRTTLEAAAKVFAALSPQPAG